MKKTKKTKIIFIAALLFLLGSMVIALMSGSYAMSLEQIVQTLIGNGSKAENMAILQIRLPRTVIAILVGMSLAVAGGVLQTVTKNDLAEPGMIGINAGAALTIVLFITAHTTSYYDKLSKNQILIMPLIAFMGAMLASILVYLLSYRKGIKPVRLILVGIGVNAGLNAVISYYQLTSSKGDFNQVLTWTNGSLWGSSWTYVKLITPLFLGVFLLIYRKSRILDVLQLGDDLAIGLGIDVKRETVIFFFLSAALSAIATAVAGNIAFLGLLGPQIARKIVGGRNRLLLPLGGLISAAILILADTAARCLFSPIELPVGIVVSLIGVPYFIYLMMREK